MDTTKEYQELLEQKIYFEAMANAQIKAISEILHDKEKPKVTLLDYQDTVVRKFRPIYIGLVNQCQFLENSRQIALVKSPPDVSWGMIL